MDELPLELLHEVRDKVDTIHTSFLEFKNQVVTKSEFNLWQEAQRNTRRWAIGTIIAVAGMLIAFAGVIIATRPEIMVGG